MLKAELWGQLIESTGLGGTLTANAELAGSIGSGVEKINVSKTLQAETRHELPTTGESDADNAVTDAKIAAMSVMKLQINAGDTLILDGGTIE